jgi:cytochrome c biogenesis protein CcmG/thiol:disulfide interchange protein DsbE
MPRLQRTYRAYRGQLLVLGVDTQDSQGSARSFLRAVSATYPQVVDQSGALRVELRAVGLPVTVLIRPDGSIAYRRLGEMHLADIDAAIASVGLSTRGPADTRPGSYSPAEKV